MSTVILITIKNNRLAVAVLPWRQAKDRIKTIDKTPAFVEESDLPLDAGYIIIDHEDRIIFSKQEAFQISPQGVGWKKLSKKWQIVY